MQKSDDRQVDLSALSELAPELAQLMVSVACDIALVLDDGGVIQSVALGGSSPGPEDPNVWVGQHWTEVVTSDTRKRAEQFLNDLSNDGVSRLRHLSHASNAGADIPMAYTAVRLGEQGLTLAVGRDMRLVAAMQERLTSAQRDIEKDYWNRRRAETRYRLLFQVATEPMIIVDANSHNVIDINRAAEALLGCATSEIYGRPLARYFADSAGGKLSALLDSAHIATRTVVEQAELARGAKVEISIAPFESESASVVCLVLKPRADLTPEPTAIESPLQSKQFARLFELTKDAVALCDLQGKLIFVNDAFRELVQSSRDDMIIGSSLSKLLAAGEDWWRDVNSLTKRPGAHHLLVTALLRPNASRIEVELSATVIADLNCVGVILRVCHAQRSEIVAFDEFEQKGFH